MTRHSVLAASGEISPLLVAGWMRAHHRISSASQLPTPGNRSCMSSTALIGEFFLRCRKSVSASRVKAGEVKSGARSGPPAWGIGAVVELHASEMTDIAKHERVTALPKHQVIVLSRREIQIGHAMQASLHAEMKSQPDGGPAAAAALEDEDHLFAARERAREPQAAEAFEGTRIDAAENPHLGMERDPGDGFALSGVPDAAAEFDLGEFGHEGKLSCESRASR